MRRTLLSFVLVLPGLVAAACVKGTPDYVGFTDLHGGDLELADCGYKVTTGEGAEAPALGLLVFGDDPTPKNVHLGIAGDPRTSMVVDWATEDQSTLATTVRFAKGRNLAPEQLTETRTGLTWAYQTGFGSVARDRFRIHETHLCGLAPDTEYSYQAGSSRGWSPVYHFRTAPDVTADPSAEVVLAFVGDSRAGYDVWEQLTEQIAERTPDLILFSGDAVQFGQVQDEWEEFFGRAEALLATVPTIAAHGNHESNSAAYYAQFALPGDEQNYSIDYGFAHITVLNDTPTDAAAIAGSTRQFLRDDLAAHQDARWKILMHHKPPFSASTRHGADNTLQREWFPIVDQNDVDLVLSGHDHDFEQSKPLVWNASQQQGQVVSDASLGTVFVVSGGAGADLYPSGTDFWTEYSEKTHSAAILQVNGVRLGMDAFRPDGSAVYQPFVKNK